MARPQPIQPKPDRINTYVRFSAPLLARIKAEARKRGLSVNRVIEQGMEEWLAGRG